MKATSLLVILAVAMGSAGVVAEQADSGQNPVKNGKVTYVKKDRHGQHHWLAGVELSDAQQLQLNDLLAQHKKQREQLTKPSDSEQRQQLRALVEADYFDESAVRQQLEQQKSLRVEQQLERLKFRHQLYQILTPEQRQQLAEKAERHSKREQRGEPRRNWHNKKPRQAAEA